MDALSSLFQLLTEGRHGDHRETRGDLPATQINLAPQCRWPLFAQAAEALRASARARRLSGIGIAFVAALLASSADSVAATHHTCFGRPATIVGSGIVHGTARADVIVTGPGDDTVDGGAGDDLICTAGGDDQIEGDGGSDRIDAGAGADSVDGGNGSDLVLGGAGVDALRGRRGNDRLFGGPGAGDFVDGGLGDDIVSGGPGDRDQVLGGLGNDKIYGGPGDGDILSGDGGRDLIDGGPGAHDTDSYALSGENRDVLGEGGVKVDLAAGHAEGDGSDTIAGIEDVVGSAFDDVIIGDGGPNVLYGGGGVDELVGGPGDEAEGGDGEDRCRGFEAPISCELSEDSTVSAPVEAEQLEDAARGRGPFVPRLQVDLAGGLGASGLTAVVENPYVLLGRPGMSVRVSYAEGELLVKESGIPILAGDSCRLIDPETASCPVTGTPEGLLITGTAGEDSVVVDPSVPATPTARISGDYGTDLIEGGAGDDILDGGPSQYGEPGDLIRGGPGDDALSAGATLEGGAGADLLIATPCAGTTVSGGPGIDSVSFARSDFGVEAQIGGDAGFAGTPRGPTRGCNRAGGGEPTLIDHTIESIEGSPFDDILRGDGSANDLLGRGGDDRIEGEGGDDFLVGGTGRDELVGGVGDDRIYARDGVRDRRLECAPGGRGDVVVRDPFDPAPVGCRQP